MKRKDGESFPDGWTKWRQEEDKINKEETEILGTKETHKFQKDGGLERIVEEGWKTLITE